MSTLTCHISRPPLYRCVYTMKMKVLVILTLLCLGMALGSPETLLKVASQLTKRLNYHRQTNCDVSSLQNYPSDCLQALRTIDTSGQNIEIPAIICEPRCGQPVINFYLMCGLDFVVPTFVELCGTNVVGQRCGTDMVEMTVNHTAIEIASNCAGTIVSGSNCTSECRNTLTNATRSPGCCIQLLNTTAITPNFINPAIDPQLWEQRCGVDLPAACPSSLSPTITNGGAVLIVCKTILAVALFLLGTLML